ncbi:MAG: type II toxin-antitoxin system ParD family antitoxin [Acidobacteriota bacterium]
MRIDLSKQDEARIAQQLDAGSYDSPSDVVAAGLRLLEQETEWLRAAAAEGIRDIESGRYVEVASEAELESFFSSLRHEAVSDRESAA